MPGIIDLQETSANNWRAKYQGNYGVYTIKIITDGKKRTKISCTCPSDASPCKHIGMVEEAIARELALREEAGNGEEPDLKELLKDVSPDEFRNFVFEQAKYNRDFRNALFMEFTQKTGNKRGNQYSLIIRKGLKSVRIHDDDYYSETGIYVEVLDQWLDKAEEFIKRQKYAEAALIAKACIEELAAWLEDADEDLAYMIGEGYQFTPFKILKAAADYMDPKELFNYCRSEMEKDKYSGISMYGEFHDLLAHLAPSVDTDAFIALQDKLLAEITDKSSSGAKTIIRRKIDFYHRIGQPEKAWAIIEENLQIKSFRKKLTERNIEEKKFAEAKKLINDFLDNQKPDDLSGRYHNGWYDLLLVIAEEEQDIPVIRAISRRFLESHFDEKNYTLYKGTFKAGEWHAEMEKLFQHYYKNGKSFSNSAAKLLAAEKATERLMGYVEKYLSTDNLENYYPAFADDFPEKTLELFQKFLDKYAENNIGRTHYEYIAGMLKKMSTIKGGKKAAAGLAAAYKLRYKNRRAMVEVLNQFMSI